MEVGKYLSKMMAVPTKRSSALRSGQWNINSLDNEPIVRFDLRSTLESGNVASTKQMPRKRTESAKPFIMR